MAVVWVGAQVLVDPSCLYDQNLKHCPKQNGGDDDEEHHGCWSTQHTWHNQEVITSCDI